MNKRITVTVGPDGQTVNVEVDGWVGPGCQKLTANLQAALGQVVEEHTKEAFFARPNTQEESITQGQ